MEKSTTESGIERACCGASNPVAAINIGFAGCQRLSRSLSEIPTFDLYRDEGREEWHGAEPAAKPHQCQGKGVYFPSALLTPGAPFFGQLPDRPLGSSVGHRPLARFLYRVYVLIAFALGEYRVIDRSGDPKGKLQLTVF